MQQLPFSRSAAGVSTKNLEIGAVTTYDYGTIKLHVYRTNDAMQDECYLVEGRDGVVILASTAFKNNINEWNDYSERTPAYRGGSFLLQREQHH